MKIKHIWLFITSMLYGVNLICQDSLTVEKNKDFKVFSLRLGIDLFKPIKTNLEENFQGVEIVGDLKINRRIFIAAELGSEKKTQQTEQLNFTTNGSYVKLGVDYNFFNNWKGMDNSLFVGIRISNSIHSHKVNEYILYEKKHRIENIKIPKIIASTFLFSIKKKIFLFHFLSIFAKSKNLKTWVDILTYVTMHYGKVVT